MKTVAGMYLLGGITLVSEIPLPELPLVQHHGDTASSEHSLGQRGKPFAGRCRGRSLLLRDLHAISSCAFKESHATWSPRGRRLSLSPDAGALPLDVRAYLLGTIFVVLCQQRGLLPLHASAIAAESGVVAFLARSGQGKSTLAAHLAQRGFRVLADDVCLIDTTAARSSHGDPYRSLVEALAQFSRPSGKASGGTGARVQRGRQSIACRSRLRSTPEPIRQAGLSRGQ